jgi:hypothetical protein
MSRGAQPFTQHQLTKAIKAAVKSGARDWRIEITDGKRKMVLTGGAAPASAPAPHDETSGDIRKIL